MKYTQGTIGIPLILPIDNYVNIKCYVDALFVVHKEVSSHTGCFVAMVTVVAYIQSSKQKLNTKS